MLIPVLYDTNQSLPNAKRENSPPRVSMERKTQSVGVSNCASALQIIKEPTEANHTAVSLPQFKVRRQESRAEKDRGYDANHDVGPSHAIAIRDL
jgi:hypothetical protein